MGKVDPSILGKFHGKVGNLVFYTLNGQLVVRQRPGQISAPPTAAQLYRREVFRLANLFLKPFRQELNFTFSNRDKPGKKGIHLGLSWLIKQAVLHGEEPSILPGNLRISQGSLAGPRNLQVQRSSGQELQFTWTPNAWEGAALEDDQAYVLVFDPRKSRVFGARFGSYRRDGQQSLLLPWDIGLTDPVWVYFAFSQKRGKGWEFSDSICVGRF